MSTNALHDALQMEFLHFIPTITHDNRDHVTESKPFDHKLPTRHSTEKAYTLHKKVKDICQYLDLNTIIKANSCNCTKKNKKNIKISLTFYL